MRQDSDANQENQQNHNSLTASVKNDQDLVTIFLHHKLPIKPDYEIVDDNLLIKPPHQRDIGGIAKSSITLLIVKLSELMQSAGDINRGEFKQIKFQAKEFDLYPLLQQAFSNFYLIENNLIHI